MLNELLCNVGQMNSKHFDTGRALGQIPASVSVFGNQSGLGRFPVKSAPSQNGLTMKVKSATYFKLNKNKLCINMN
jgi:hypothetical protein